MFNFRIKSKAKRIYSELLNTIVSLKERQPDNNERLVMEVIRLCTGDRSFAPAKMAGYAESRAEMHKRDLTLADIVYGILVEREGIFDGAILNMSPKKERTLDAIERAVEALPEEAFVASVSKAKRVK